MFGIVGSALFGVLAVAIIAAQQQPPRFGGAYSELDARRQHLVDDWVGRFIKVTGQSLDARAFYDDILSLSTKTTFDAVTHALMTTPLTDASGRSSATAWRSSTVSTASKAKSREQRAIANSGCTSD